MKQIFEGMGGSLREECNKSVTQPMKDRVTPENLLERFNIRPQGR